MFREFQVGELFDINDTIKFNPRNNHLPTGDVPYITRTSKNNGQFDSYSDESGQFTNKGNCITVGIEGAVAFYQPTDFIAGINVYTLRHERMTQRIGLYLCSVLNMQSWKYGFVNGRTLGRIKAETIQLPVKPGTDEANYTEDDIDWCYMESYIQELEESYIQELDAYLKETGLDDYTLTDDEQALLEREPVFKEFEVGELFDINDTIKFNPRNNHLPTGDVPYITRTSKNNGQFDSYSDESGQFTNKGNCITVGIEGAVAFYQPTDFIAGINVYTLRHERMTQRIGLYLCSVLNMQSWKYGFVNGRTLGRIKAETIQLPVKPGTDEVNYTEDDIDWDYIEAYVRAMEKQVIADVVDYKNEVIATTKGLIKN